MTSDDPAAAGRIERRAFLASLGGLGLALGAAGRLGDRQLAAGQDTGAGADEPTATVPFHGPHQGGIATPPQHHLRFASFDVVGDDRHDLAELLQAWSAAAAQLTRGRSLPGLDDDLLAPPTDTGEAIGSGPANLTITFGLGPGLFGRPGRDRFGLAADRPAALVDLPPFAGDELDPSSSDGDLAVQACADDPLVAFHAVHDLIRLASGVATPRWTQLGFGRTSSTSRQQVTPRNLMGYKDGTNNIATADDALMGSQVWVGGEGPAWMQGGTYLVARRIRMRLEKWDRAPLEDQQRTIGRLKYSGAPLGAVHEFDPVDLEALDDSGQPVIPAGSHIREAAPASNGGAHLLRRGYSFDDGIDATGEQRVGLFFVCFQRDPRRQFIPVQRRLAAADGLNDYTTHTASAIFACPPGAADGRWVGQELFGSCAGRRPEGRRPRRQGW